MIRIVQRLLATGAALAALHAGPALAASLNGFDLGGALIPESAIERGGPPKDGIPAIDHPASFRRVKQDSRPTTACSASCTRVSRAPTRCAS
jgi:hypothetical protein